MKHLKTVLLIFILFPFLSYGQTSNNSTVSDLLDYINIEVGKYNKYEAHFDVEGTFLVFANKFGKANIPFSEIGFRIDEKTYSIDIFCLDNEKCIKMYNNGKISTWNYYNVSMPDNDGMSSEIYIVLEKCKKLKKNVLGSNQDNEDLSIDELLAHINSEIGQYNKYGSRLSVDGKNLIFMNDYGRANIPFQAIDFRMNKKHKSIDIYCLDDSKCIDKYDNSQKLTSWNYYNISMPDGDKIAATAENVLEKCKILKKKSL